MTESIDQTAGALVLIIEDEDTQRLLTRDCLEESGFRVEEAPDGENAVSLIQTLRPDLVLLDVMLPGIDGFEVCRQIRSDNEICHTPVVLITGRDNTNDVKRGFSAGATDFFAKPVRWNLLPTRIEFVLRTSRLERELRISKETAEKANAAKSTLLSTMGHELRTPLNAVIGFTEIMKQQVYGPVGAPEYEDFLEDIHASGSQLLKGINDVLEIVNSESLELPPDTPHVSFFDIVKQVVAAAKKMRPQVVSVSSRKFRQAR
ncbi:MAG: CheY-like chemotaxis protein [Paracoccaceae bacterium]|jgi:CheY-like chemotaxis protein